MNPRHRGRWTLAACSASLLFLSGSGCARSGSLLANGSKRGSIRENLSRLEFQNRRLREDLETARNESERLAGDLQHSEIDNQRLESKVDRYRMQLGANDDGDPVVGAYEPLRRPDAGDAARSNGTATIPASRRPSRAPFTQVPNRVTIPAGPPPDQAPSPYDAQPRPIIEPPPVRFFGPTGASAAPVGRFGGLTEESRTWSPLARGGTSDDWEYR